MESKSPPRPHTEDEGGEWVLAKSSVSMTSHFQEKFNILSDCKSYTLETVFIIPGVVLWPSKNTISGELFFESLFERLPCLTLSLGEFSKTEHRHCPPELMSGGEDVDSPLHPVTLDPAF
jgi:hypothetical protein